MVSTISATSKPSYADKPLPWENTGVDVSDTSTWKDAVEKAGLDYSLAMGPVWGGPYRTPMSKKRAVFREDTGVALTITGTTFRPVQRRDMAEFMDALVANRTMRFLKAGGLQGGVKAWFLAELEDDILIGQDKYIPYLMGIDSCDGQTALKLFPTVVNVVSSTSLSIALRHGGTRFHIRHTGDIATKLDMAKQVLDITTEDVRRLRDWFNNLKVTAVVDADVERTRELMLGPEAGAASRKQKAIDLFRSIYEQESKRNGENGYSLLTSAVGYADHGTAVHNKGTGEERMLSSYFGGVSYTKQKAIESVVNVTAQEY